MTKRIILVLKSLSVFFMFVHLCPLSRRSLNRLVFRRGSEACWVIEKGETGTSQTDGDVVCVCAGRRLAGVKRLWIYQLPDEGQTQRLPDPTITLTHAHTHTSSLSSPPPPPSCVCLHLGVCFFWVACCFIVFIYPSIPL